MRHITVLLSIVATAAPWGWQAPFKVQTDLVRVDVLVERNGQPVAGLTAGDFAVEDNGVRQRVALLPAGGFVHVSTVVDLSASMSGTMLEHVAGGLRALTDALESRDRATLYAVSGDVRQIPLSRHAEAAAAWTHGLRGGRGMHTPLFDAMFAAVLQGAGDDPPRMLVVLTDGRNNTSWLTADDVIDAANRHETVIYPVAVRSPTGLTGDTPPMAADEGLRLLQILADRTGGRIVHATWSRDLRAVFTSILDEYRHRYILTFTPEGVARGDGWHRLQVRLRNKPGRVHVRSGYWSR